MESNKLDRLFREKSEDFRPTPSPMAWDTINDKLGKQPSGWYRSWHAAAAAVVIIAGAIWILQQPAKTAEMVAMSIDHPKNWTATIGFELPEAASTNNSEPRDAPSLTNVVTTTPSAMTPETDPGKLGIAELHPIEKISLAIAFESHNPSENITDHNQPAISIRYYTSAQEKTESTKKGLGGFISRAQELRPGQLFADLRAAKDELFASRNK